MAGRNRWANNRRVAQALGARRAAGNSLPGQQGRARFRFEGYGPGGAAVMIDCLTDDAGRLGGAVRHAFAQHGGQVGAADSVSYLFNNVGLMAYPPGSDARRLQRLAIAAGAEDVVLNDDASVEVLTDPRDFSAVRACLSEQGLAPLIAEITWRAASVLELSGDAGRAMLALLQALEGLPGGCEVYSNVEIAAEALNET